MLKDLLKNPRALFLAILVHVVLMLLLVVSLQWVRPPPTLQGSEKIVQAVVIDESKTRAAAEHAKQVELKKQAEEEAKRKAAAEEQQRQREAEQRKVDEGKKQQAEERQRQEQEIERALAEKQRNQERRLAEQETKRKMEAEQKRRTDAEAKRKAEEQVKRKAEEDAKKAEAAEARRKADEEARRKAEDARREREAKEQLQQQLAQEEQARLAGEREKKLDSLRAQYIALITQKVQRNWLRPSSARVGMSCEVFVRLIPGGEVVEARVVKSSGDVMYDRSVETAVFKASPLPMPADPGLIDQFRELRFVFKPEG